MPERLRECIEVGKAYKLYGVMKEQPKKLCYVVGRQGSTISVLIVGDVALGEVGHCEGEYAKVRARDGVYNLFPCNLVKDPDEVAAVCDMIRNS